MGIAPITASYTCDMSRSVVERRLAEVSERLKVLRRDLALTDEQLAHLDGEADDARLRALVAETPLGEKEFREAQKHADAMRSHRVSVHAEITDLERAQDELLDRFIEER